MGGAVNIAALQTLGTVEMNCATHGAYTAEKKAHFTTGCPHCRAEQTAQMMAQFHGKMLEHNREVVEREAREKIAQAVDIPPRFVGKTVSGWQPEGDSEEKIKKSIGAYGGALLEKREVGCLVLHGNKGTGKTHLACALLALVKGQLGGSVQYIVAGDLFRKVRESKNFKSAVTESEIVNQYANFDLLAIDEIGNQAGSDEEIRLLFDVLNKRYEKGKPTIVLSNLLRDDLVKLLGEVVWDRLQDGGMVLQFDGRSRRVGFGVGNV